MPMTVEELQVLITGETRQLRQALDQVKKQLGRTDREVSKITNSINKTLRTIGAALASIGIGAFFTSATKDAMQFEAALQQINRLMGSSAAEFQRWAAEQASAFGFARSEAIKYGAIYANLLSGFSRDTAETMQRTRDLLQASAIVAGGTGRSIEDVMERIRSGLLGNTEAIEDLGINVNVALIESTKAFREFAGDRSWQQLDFNTQQTIRYFAILEQAAAKYGDELAQNTATRHAVFIAQLKDARLALGQFVLPIYNAVLPALTRLASSLAAATRFLAEFSRALFGYNQAQQTAQTQAQASAVNELGDAYEKAGKQAKGAVAGFDQLNLVGGKVSGSEAAGAGGGAPLADLTDQEGALSSVTEAMDTVSSKARELADKVRRALGVVRDAYGEMSGFIRRHSDIIIAALAGVGAAFGTAFLVSKWASISAGVANAIAAIRTALVGLAAAFAAVNWWAVAIAAAIGTLVAGFVYFYRTNETFRGVVDGILRKIGETAQWLWESVLKPFGTWLADVMVKAWGAVSKSAEWLWKNVLVPLGNFLIWLWNNVFVPVGRVLVDVLAVAFEFVADVAKSFWRNVLVPLGQALSEMLWPAVEAVSAVLMVLWQDVLKPFGVFLSGLIKGVLADLVDTFEYLWYNVLKPLAQFVGGEFKYAFDNTFRAIGSVIDGLKTTFIGLMNFITGVFTRDWGRAWNGVRDIFKGVFDSLWAIVKTPLNMIIDGINTLIGGLNKISIDIPDWVTDLTGAKGGKFGFNIPKIPRLDVGTNYVPRDMLAVIHKGEAVVPKEYNPAAGGQMASGDSREMIQILRAILQAVREPRTVQAVISRSEVGRAAIETIKDVQRRTGRLPFPV